VRRHDYGAVRAGNTIRRLSARACSDAGASGRTRGTAPASWSFHRNRLAQEIHDTLAQNFLAIRMQAQVAAHKKTTNWKDIERLATDGIEQARRSINDLLPARVDEVGLREALLEWIDDQSLERSEEVEAVIAEGLPDCNPAVEFALFRIAQESLQNVFKHAQATRVDLVLIRDDDSLVLTVRDNGTGFDPKNIDGGSSHFGLVSMRQRASRYSGKLSISSSPGNGTLITASIPVKRPAG